MCYSHSTTGREFLEFIRSRHVDCHSVAIMIDFLVQIGLRSLELIEVLIYLREFYESTIAPVKEAVNTIIKENPYYFTREEMLKLHHYRYVSVVLIVPEPLVSLMTVQKFKSMRFSGRELSVTRKIEDKRSK